MTASRADSVPCTADARPLIAHVLFRLDVGGLENGLVNLINGLPPDRYRHAIVCIDDYTAFADRIARDDVGLVAIRKKPGTDPGALWRLYRTFRALRPAIVHTRNLAALDALLPATLAGVRHRVHGEHGWDVNDLGGRNRKLRLLRRLHAPLVSRYIPLSADLERYLTEAIGVSARRIVRICNGVDVERFTPRAEGGNRTGLPPGFAEDGEVLVGTVGRLQAVKDPLNLVNAFALLIERRPELAACARLALVGDGPLHEAVRDRLEEAGIRHLAWMAGSRDDVPVVLRSLDVFVQPSLAEGISNTILEAMASGLPVVATDVGGNSELVDDGTTGVIVPPADPGALATALADYVDDATRRRRHGRAGRERAERTFSIDAMVGQYRRVYDELLENDAET